MRRKRLAIIAIILTIIGILLSLASIAGDTGKYRILAYKVKLTPYSDGKVKMEYYQKWQVESGHIPWITVGTANESYQITGWGLNAKKVTAANEGDWDGVKVELDRDYKPGETFEVSFALDQSKLFYAKDSSYRLEFTPGWYDRAFIDTLVIGLKCFFKLETAQFDPKPTSIDQAAGEVFWLKTKLAKGEKFSASFSFPQKLVKEFPEENLKANLPILLILIIVIVVIILVILFVGWLGSGGGGGGYSGGGVFYGGSGGGYSGGGGGGFGGSSSSCACACVSCACACACAGGGGAGCTRKSKHRCPICDPKKERS